MLAFAGPPYLATCLQGAHAPRRVTPGPMVFMHRSQQCAGIEICVPARTAVHIRDLDLLGRPAGQQPLDHEQASQLRVWGLQCDYKLASARLQYDRLPTCSRCPACFFVALSTIWVNAGIVLKRCTAKATGLLTGCALVCTQYERRAIAWQWCHEHWGGALSSPIGPAADRWSRRCRSRSHDLAVHRSTTETLRWPGGRCSKQNASVRYASLHPAGALASAVGTSWPGSAVAEMCRWRRDVAWWRWRLVGMACAYASQLGPLVKSYRPVCLV